MKNKIISGVSLLFGLMFINSGLNKFFNYMPMPGNLPASTLDTMTVFMKTGWILPLIAIIEITGGLIFMIPKCRALGAIVIFPVMTCILLFHIVQDRDNIAIALVLFAVNLWIIIEERSKYFPMISYSKNH